MFAVRPVIDADTATALLPEPGDGTHGALAPYEVEMPYSSLHSLTTPPFGLTLAFNIADVCATLDAGSVVTVGAFGSVFRVASLPVLVPLEFLARTLKWYVVFAARLVIDADTATALVPDPGDGTHGALDP